MCQVLCPTYDPEKAEQKLRTRDRRLADFEALPWWESVIGNQYLNGPAYESSTIAVPLLGWRWWIYGQVRIWSAAAYDTRPAARGRSLITWTRTTCWASLSGPGRPFPLWLLFRKSKRSVDVGRSHSNGNRMTTT